MAAVKIRELPEEDRPREKLLKRGADALTNRELIAILLRTGVRGKNAVEVGGEILEKYKTLSGLTRTSASELRKIRGIGLRQSSATGGCIQARRTNGQGKNLARKDRFA